MVPPRELRANLERRVTQSLCQCPAQGAAHESTRQRLKSYRWQEPLHQAIFETLRDLPPLPADALRRQLPARLTRRGFPDVNWEEFFAPPAASPDELEGLLGKLLALAD